MLAAKNAGMTVIAYTNGDKKNNFDIADFRLDSFENNEIELIIKN